MALKERIPSPTDIANQVANQRPNQRPNPESPEQKNTQQESAGLNTTKKEIKFESKELEEIKTLQANMNALLYKLGQLKLSEMKIEVSKKTMSEALIKLENQESELAKKLNEKYGRGTLDVETGTFISTK